MAQLNFNEPLWLFDVSIISRWTVCVISRGFVKVSMEFATSAGAGIVHHRLLRSIKQENASRSAFYETGHETNALRKIHTSSAKRISFGKLLV